MAREIELDPEDGVCLEDAAPRARSRCCASRSSACRTSRTSPISACWRRSPSGSRARWTAASTVVILPGTKNTIGDLEWLRAAGLADWVLAQSAAGAAVIGVCGGYQMMGEIDRRPAGRRVGAERSTGSACCRCAPPCGPRKRSSGARPSRRRASRFAAYEIHMGETTPPARRRAVRDTRATAPTDGVRSGSTSARISTARWSAPTCSPSCWDVRSRRPRPSAATTNSSAEWFDQHQRGFEEMYL